VLINRINRGNFSFAFALQVLAALGVTQLQIGRLAGRGVGSRENPGGEHCELTDYGAEPRLAAGKIRSQLHDRSDPITCQESPKAIAEAVEAALPRMSGACALLQGSIETTFAS
jgi:hypothetical protein